MCTKVHYCYQMCTETLVPAISVVVQDGAHCSSRMWPSSCIILNLNNSNTRPYHTFKLSRDSSNSVRRDAGVQSRWRRWNEENITHSCYESCTIRSIIVRNAISGHSLEWFAVHELFSHWQIIFMRNLRLARFRHVGW
jgi:hypothetical protein